MAGNQVDQLNKPQEFKSDFTQNPNFQAAVKKFGEAEATAAYKKAEEIAMSELAANKERPKGSGQIVETNNPLEPEIIPKGLGATKLESSAQEAPDSPEFENRVLQLMTSILNGEVKVDIERPDQVHQLVNLLNGDPEALKGYLEASKN